MKVGMQLGITQKQSLTLTPALLLSIRILGLSRTELDEYLAEELVSNPALELSEDEAADEAADEADEIPDDRVLPDRRAEDFDWGEYLAEKEYEDSGASYMKREAFGFEQADEETDRSLRGYLFDQLTETALAAISGHPGRAAAAALSVIESLDSSGFLEISLNEIAKIAGVSEREAEAAIEVVKELDPAGVGARDARESLLIQYARKGGSDSFVRRIIEDHLEDVASGRIARISRNLGLTIDETLHAVEIVKSLDPKPGRGFAGSEQISYIVPDVIVEKVGDDFEVTVNDAGMPRLFVSPYYRNVLKSEDRDSEASVFLRGRLHAAATLIKSLEQREKTVYNITVAIFRRQREFLENGVCGLRPLTLKMLADELGIHESTVSRSVRGKYAQTPRGVFELKRFFSSGVRTADGEGASGESLRAKISELIGAEDKNAPLSDEKIAENLKRNGAFISRRTVAKYREEMCIPSSSARRQRR
ncbi:MAG: RNA polymerase factor sigma-54 [Clostridiales Family XIII bacterium]|jgi:RNA polymerase sigma-54 factor|nr:RNA polymerase factor sigma-54 [Clostridiales Family XIII bacterium]